MEPAPQALDIIRNCRGYKPADKEPQNSRNNATERPANPLLRVHHRKPGERGHHRLQNDHPVDTHYCPHARIPGRGSMSATLNNRKNNKECPCVPGGSPPALVRSATV